MEKTASAVELKKESFKTLARGITRPGADIEGLLEYLESTDFFEAPMTANAYRNYEGGLCEQALVRYETIEKVYKTCAFDGVDPNSLAIVSLFADFGRINYFEKTVKNKKVYSPTGKKFDAMGNFDWVAEPGYVVKAPEERYIFGTLGQNAERILTDFVPLTNEESSAIINLHSDYENPNLNMATIYMSIPLAVLLNVADKITSFITTRDDIAPF